MVFLLICIFGVLRRFKIHITVLTLFFFGLGLMPNQGFACVKKSRSHKEAICAKKQSEMPDVHTSCKDKLCKKHDESEHRCDDTCKHNACGCNVSTISPCVITSIEVKEKNQFKEVPKKQRFYFEQTYFSSGFSSIWLPPKIS